ncbi:MAG: (E)-4-hydroxy-3-methylbut-2-enyl-diphosphate synthase, partial [Muribaculaceae bacterium]|nr:(E)-4-hydroxy-3-methylbut-2-enyl-diphosphate synthase [Muribaculaceae bacterium]
CRQRMMCIRESPGRVFKHIDYTDEEYAAELDRISRTFVPFLELCRENGTAIRIGVNHGSLSDRIMSRYGDTPAGMVESAMEFLRIAVANDFRNIVISIKASNTVVMVETVMRLVKAMDAEDMHFPLHLGVTEAGAGDDGRIKSAVGIGTLLAHGIGDTIRVSLSEDPECEIPVARDLVDYVLSKGYIYEDDRGVKGCRKRPGTPVTAVNADGNDSMAGHYVVDAVSDNQLGDIYKAVVSVGQSVTVPCIARLRYDGLSPDEVKLRAASDAGALLLGDMVDGIWIESDSMSGEELASLELDILQAARCRFTKTEFISCPGCGRTLFDLQSTVKMVKESLSHLTGLKIAVMGCIVNGPGEMADADYGYVGAAAGKVSLYRGKECVERNIPQEDALDHLVQLLKNDGRWLDPKTRS